MNKINIRNVQVRMKVPGLWHTGNEGEEVHVLLYSALTLGSSRDSRLWTLYTLSALLCKTQPLSIGLIETQVGQLIFSGMNILQRIFPRAVFCLHHFLLCVCTHMLSTYPNVYPHYFWDDLLIFSEAFGGKSAHKCHLKKLSSPYMAEGNKPLIWLLGYMF